MAANTPPILQIYQAGPTTVVGFGGRDVMDDVNLAVCRDELLELIDREKCEILAVDMTGVKLIPSGMLGLLASIHNQGVRVQVFNPSPDVRDVFATTRLDTLIEMREVDIP